MAEGGGDGGRENPFSFIKFVEKKDICDTDCEEDEKRASDPPPLDLPDVSAGQAGDKTDGSNLEKDTNPFSFKKFLQSGSKRPAPSSLATLDLANDLPDFVLANCGSGSESRSLTRPAASNLVHQVTEKPGPLPDFALDSAGSTSSNLLRSSPEAQSSRDNLLGSVPQENAYAPLPPAPPPHASDGQAEQRGASGSVPDLQNNVLRPSDILDEGAGPNLDSNPGSSDADSSFEGGSVPQDGSTGGLPDFLSDSALSGIGARPKVSHGPIENGCGLEDVYSSNSAENVELELMRLLQDSTSAQAIQPVAMEETTELPAQMSSQTDSLPVEEKGTQLRAENTELRSELREAREFSEKESKRVALVLQEMELLQKKETEENTALESMVQQVEANLTTSTQRAVAAEAMVAKLKHEVKSLQAQLQAARAENELLGGGAQHGVDPVKEKARYAADQLSTAVRHAEESLKKLLGGVETLKLVSNVLASIDKIADMPTGTETGSSASAASSPASEAGTSSSSSSSSHGASKC